MILSVRTDKPEAELGLYNANGKQVAYHTWQAHRELSNTLLQTFEAFLRDNDVRSDGLQAVIFYEGPGSFTGLRIGAAFVNALELPVVNASGEDWQAVGIRDLPAAKTSGARPQYGAEAYTTNPKK